MPERDRRSGTSKQNQVGTGNFRAQGLLSCSRESTNRKVAYIGQKLLRSLGKPQASLALPRLEGRAGTAELSARRAMSEPIVFVAAKGELPCKTAPGFGQYSGGALGARIPVERARQERLVVWLSPRQMGLATIAMLIRQLVKVLGLIGLSDANGTTTSSTYASGLWRIFHSL
jgi:hypothetical protein